jgi:hypothetical protein
MSVPLRDPDPDRPEGGFARGIELAAALASLAAVLLFSSMAIVNFGYFSQVTGLNRFVGIGDVFFGSVTLVGLGLRGLFLPLAAPLMSIAYVFLLRRYADVARRYVLVIWLIALSLLMTAALWFPSNPGPYAEGFVLNQAATALMIASFFWLPTANILALAPASASLAYGMTATVAWVFSCYFIGFTWLIADAASDEARYNILLGDGRCIERGVVRTISAGTILIDGPNDHFELLMPDAALLLTRVPGCGLAPEKASSG